MQSTPYSQFKAIKALVKASLRSMSKSPSSIVFSLAFPLIIILVFGFMSNKGATFNLVLAPNSDTNNVVYKGLQASGVINIKANVVDPKLQEKSLMKGDVMGILSITKNEVGDKMPLAVNITTSLTQQIQASQLNAMIHDIVIQSDPNLKSNFNQIAQIKQTVLKAQEYKVIDFILPGQLGFSLLAASVFGTAFVFYHMRQMLVLKRFFATPIKRSNVLLSEGISRLIFQLLGALMIILIGRYAFDFTLINGFVTVVQMLVVCAIGLLVFMSFGFVISGLAKSDASIPPLANIFTMPQFLLAGTFFSIDVLPNWLAFFAKLMPLTAFNNAVRAIAFDGANLWMVKGDILLLLVWGVIGYALATKLFKWE